MASHKAQVPMHPDRLKWNRKHQLTGPDTRPSESVVRHCRLAAPGRALDIAAGNGRNALFLADRDFAVDAVDISDVGLRLFAGRHANVAAICADLETYDIAANRYALIINVNYLNRRLFPFIQDALVPGGVLIFETFLHSPGFQPRKPFCPNHLLKPGELILSFPDLKTLVSRESTVPAAGDPFPSALLVAVKAKAGARPKTTEYLSSTGSSPEGNRCGCRRK